MTVPSAFRVANRYIAALEEPRSWYIRRLVPEGARVVDNGGTDLVIFVWEVWGSIFHAAVWQGDVATVLWRDSFDTDRERDLQIRKTISKRKSQLKQRAKELEDSEVQHNIRVGDIFYIHRPGFHNNVFVKFYEVVALKVKAVIIRPIASLTVKDEKEKGERYVKPQPGVYLEPPMAKIPPQTKDPAGKTLRIENRVAKPWDGIPKYERYGGKFRHPGEY